MPTDFKLDAENSYTIFLLPFAYEEEQLHHPMCGNHSKTGVTGDLSEGLSWRPLDWRQFENHDAGDKKVSTPECSAIWRLNYFMPETGVLLFKRAQWYELVNGTGSKAHVLPGSNPENSLTLVPPGMPGIPLKLDWARLVLFEPGKSSIPFAKNGILMLKIRFEKSGLAPSLNHLLWLNEAFRYYKLPYYLHADQITRHEVIKGLPGPKEAEDRAASYWAMWEKLLRIPLQNENDSKRWRLASEGWFRSAAKNAMTDESKLGQVSNGQANAASAVLPTFDSLRNSLFENSGTWDTYPDNRAFVWTCAKFLSSEKLPPLNKKWDPTSARGSEEQSVVDAWHALLDVDRSPDAVDQFRYRWLRERTYQRWTSAGSYYGFNNFSCALFGQPAPFLANHFETFYLDMGLILLQIRTSLFRLSRQLSDDTQTRLKYRTKAWDRTFRQLRSDFASFVNLYQFPLLSTQQQAIEMYAMMRKWFDVDDLFAEVKSEIEATHEIAELVADKRNESSLQAITIGGLGIAFGALVGQVFGMSNILGDLLKNDPQSFWTQTRWVVCSVILGSLVSLLWLWLGKKSRS